MWTMDIPVTLHNQLSDLVLLFFLLLFPSKRFHMSIDSFICRIMSDLNTVSPPPHHLALVTVPDPEAIMGVPLGAAKSVLYASYYNQVLDVFSFK